MENHTTNSGNPPLMTESVAAGFPSPAEQYIDTPLDLNRLLIKKPAATFFVRAIGDSMTGAGIQTGDILVVDRSRTPENGAVVIACLDGEFTVKYYRVAGQQISLEPANPAYPVISIDGDMELQIFGVVTANIHQF